MSSPSSLSVPSATHEKPMHSDSSVIPENGIFWNPIDSKSSPLPLVPKILP
jgi:hypothetical protein